MAYRSNSYINNPYMPRMPYPQYNQPMRTPEQYQADLLKQLQPNLDMYNQQYADFQKQQNMMANSGQYVKVASYEETKNIQAPSDGRPVIIIDDVNGFLYSKKFDNGQEYIKAFRLVPNEVINEEAPKNAEEQETKNNPVLDEILKRLERLEGKENGTDGLTTEPIKNAEPSRV